MRFAIVSKSVSQFLDFECLFIERNSDSAACNVHYILWTMVEQGTNGMRQ